MSGKYKSQYDYQKQNLYQYIQFYMNPLDVTSGAFLFLVQCCITRGQGSFLDLFNFNSSRELLLLCLFPLSLHSLNNIYVRLRFGLTITNSTYLVKNQCCVVRFFNPKSVLIEFVIPYQQSLKPFLVVKNNHFILCLRAVNSQWLFFVVERVIEWRF